MKKLKLFFKRLRKLETDNEIFWRVCREKGIRVEMERSTTRRKGEKKYTKAPRIKNNK